ncbi:MAG: DUF1700 domain-containing protein [Oscillospiraceae bacterium]|nr:DUF1700 domain-containing protein [Oscillospiraceae bacterium]
MNKEQFLLALYDELHGLPIDDVERSIAYYREMIDERIEDGMSEEQAVAELGSVEEIARQIKEEIPFRSLVREKVTGGRKMPAWEIVLLVIGFPLWFSLGVAAASVLFAVYVTIWALVLALYATMLGLAVGAVASVAAIFFAFGMGFAETVMMAGYALVCAGLAAMMLLLANAVTRGVVRASKGIWLWVRSLFMRKEDN